MMVVVEQRQKVVAVSGRHQRVGARGVDDDDDDLVVFQTRCHYHSCQFVRSPCTGTESRFPRKSLGGLLPTVHTSSGVGPLSG